MRITFFENEPIPRFHKVGVQGDHLSDTVEFELSNVQGYYILSNFTPSLKIANKSKTYCDVKTDLSVEVEDGRIILTYTFPEDVTLQGSVDCQLCFSQIVTDDETGMTSTKYYWQTKIFNITFDVTIDAGEIMNDFVPDILQDLLERMTVVESYATNVKQDYASMYYFPNVGDVNVIYVDKSTNSLYRYDKQKKYYYCVGTDYNQIDVIDGAGKGE